MKFQIILENRSAFPVTKMYQILGVSPSGYYCWAKAPIPARRLEKERLEQLVKEMYDNHRGMVAARA